MLIYDGHRSHETIELREAADRAKIHLFCIPPHTSHRLQPLDVGVFGHLQRAWQKRCLRVLEETGESITRRNVVKEYMAARTDSITEELVVSAWRKSGIRPLDPQVFTEEDYAPSYSSSVNPPLPVLFPDLDNNPGASSGGPNEDNRGIEDPGGESDTVMDASGLNVAGALPDPEISSFSAQPSQLPTPSISSDETGRVLHQEGRNDPPDQSSTERSCRQLSFPLTPPIDPRHRQTRSLSRSLSQSLSRHGSTSSTQSVSPEYVKLLEERLKDSQKSNDEWRTHCHFMYGVITQLQNQLQSKGKKKGTHAKRTQAEARVLTSEEGRLELQQLREEVRLKEERQAEEAARKATEDEARRKRRADASRIFTGPLNKARRKGDLEDIAAALALPDEGKKDDLLERISRHFEEHPDLKTNQRFEGLFNPRPRKRARLADVPVAGPSTMPPPPPIFPYSSSFPSVFGPGPASTPHANAPFTSTPFDYTLYFAPQTPQ